MFPFETCSVAQSIITPFNFPAVIGSMRIIWAAIAAFKTENAALRHVVRPIHRGTVADQGLVPSRGRLSYQGFAGRFASVILRA